MATDGELSPGPVKGQPSLLSSTVDTSLNSRSYRQSLADVISGYFPQYGPLKYVPIEVNSWEAAAPSSSSSHSPFPSPASAIRCSLQLFGVAIETTKTFDRWEEAQEETARLGLLLVEEFLRLLMARQDNPLFGTVPRPVVQDPPSSLSSSQSVMVSSRGSLSEEHPMKVLTLENDQEVREAQQNFLGPLIGPILGHRGGTLERKVRNRASDQQARMATDTPLSALNRHWQGHSSSMSTPSTVLARPKIESFAQARHFGATGQYAGYEVFVGALYLRKNDARQEAARLLCLQIMGDVSLPQRIPSDIDSHGTIEGRVRNDDDGHPIMTDTGGQSIPLGSKQKLPSREPLGSGSEATKERDTLVTTAPSGTGLDLDILKDLPSGPLAARGKERSSSFIAILNEFCQKTHISTPEFSFYHHVKSNQAQAFSCRVVSFPTTTDGLAVRETFLPPARSFMSYLFGRRQEAKEDCAGRIVEYLIEEGSMTPQGQPTKLLLSGKRRMASPRS